MVGCPKVQDDVTGQFLDIAYQPVDRAVLRVTVPVYKDQNLAACVAGAQVFGWRSTSPLVVPNDAESREASLGFHDRSVRRRVIGHDDFMIHLGGCLDAGANGSP